MTEDRLRHLANEYQHVQRVQELVADILDIKTTRARDLAWEEKKLTTELEQIVAEEKRKV